MASKTTDKSVTPKTPSVDEINTYLKNEFPAEYALMSTDDQLKKVMLQAGQERISDPTKLADFIRTEYPSFFETHQQDQIDADNARLNEWATYATKYNDFATWINNYINKSGLTIDPKALGAGTAFDAASYDPNNPNALAVDTQDSSLANKVTDPNNIISKLLSKYYNGSLSDPLIQSDIVAQLRSLHSGAIAGGATTPVGDVAGNINSLKKLAQQYGVGALALPVDPSGQIKDPFEYAATNISAGTASLDTYTNMMKNTAMNMFPGFKQQISDGALVSDLAAPYTNTLAQLLEVSPASIDLSSTTGDGAMVAKAMAGNAQNGNQPMNLWDFQNQVRNDPRWQYTANAKSTVLDQTSNLLRSFGLVRG